MPARASRWWLSLASGRGQRGSHQGRGGMCSTLMSTSSRARGNVKLRAEGRSRLTIATERTTTRALKQTKRPLVCAHAAWPVPRLAAAYRALAAPQHLQPGALCGADLALAHPLPHRAGRCVIPARVLWSRATHAERHHVSLLDVRIVNVSDYGDACF